MAAGRAEEDWEGSGSGTRLDGHGECAPRRGAERGGDSEKEEENGEEGGERTGFLHRLTLRGREVASMQASARGTRRELSVPVGTVIAAISNF